MISTIFTFKRGIIIRPNCYSQIQTVFVMRSKQRIFTKNCGRIEICLTIVIIQKIANFLTQRARSKDEAAGIPIVEFIGLRSKMYSYTKDNGKNEKMAKGLRKYVIRKNTLMRITKIAYVAVNTIRSECHQIGVAQLF